MQWRALICGCSIRTLHKGALPTTVLLWIMCISTAAPDSALRCSMTVGGGTRSRRLMAERNTGSRFLGRCSTRALARQVSAEGAKTQNSAVALVARPACKARRTPEKGATSAAFPPRLWWLTRTPSTRNMNAIAGALDQGSEAEKQGAPLSPAAAYLPATLTAAIPASSQRCCRSSRRCS